MEVIAVYCQNRKKKYTVCAKFNVY